MDGRPVGRHRKSLLLTGVVALSLVWLLAATPVAQDMHQRLWEAAAAGDIEGIRTLLSGPDSITVDAADALGWTALMHAADAGRDAAVQLLLDAGSDLELKNAEEVAPLHLAARSGRTRVVQHLLDAGANFQVRDAAGRTPLFLAIDGGHADVIEVLHGAARAAVNQQSPALALTVEDATIPPVIIQWTDPDYTDTALAEQVEGSVVLMAIVRHDGSVGAASVSESLEDSLDQNALRSVRGWRFDPARRDGKPVDVVVTISVAFRLPETP